MKDPAYLKAATDILTDQEAYDLLYDWSFWARPTEQRPDGTWTGQLAPPGNWRIWIMLAGRGYGKTRSGAEWVLQRVREGAKQIALVGRTAADVRDVMLGPPAGLLHITKPDEMPVWVPSARAVYFPNGARAITYSAQEPASLRGPQHDTAWCDEIAQWMYEESWDNLMMGMRMGDDPRVCVTTTPKPRKFVKAILKDPMTCITRGSTYDNLANLAPAFAAQIIKKYEHTRLGRQELLAELLVDNPAALWSQGQIDKLRVQSIPSNVRLIRVVVGVDPGVSSEDGAAKTGIIVAAKGNNGHAYVTRDCSLRGRPREWASAVVGAYHESVADCVVAEVNNGGEMVAYTVSTVDRSVNVKAVHASRGKQTRAEPISSLYEQGLVHHVGLFETLEDQQCNWNPETDESPDEMDASVWALTELMLHDSSLVEVGVDGL